MLEQASFKVRECLHVADLSCPCLSPTTALRKMTPAPSMGKVYCRAVRDSCLFGKQSILPNIRAKRKKLLYVSHRKGITGHVCSVTHPDSCHLCYFILCPVLVIFTENRSSLFTQQLFSHWYNRLPWDMDTGRKMES